MDICPLCHQCLEEGQSLQLHYILCPANIEIKDQRGDRKEKSVVNVRLRWAKVEPCVDRIVHLISSLAGSIPLHWSDKEGLYESAMTEVPVGMHSCQLAVGGDVMPIDAFDVAEHSDTIYIIPTEEEEIPEEIEEGSEDGIIDDDDNPVAELLASTSIAGSNDLSKEEYPGTSGELRHGVTGDNLSPEDRERLAQSSFTELSPLYKELLQHQVIHGEPSWVPKGDDQSPITSDYELDEVMNRTRTEEGAPPHLTSRPANPEERHLKSPIPIRAISNQDERHLETLPGTRGESTEEQGPGTEDVKGQDHHDNQSPAASSSTSSGSSSEHSSARHSPDLSDVANDSDASDGLQEQSIEEAIPRDSPEIQELPQPYDGTFLTRDIIEDVPSKKDTRNEERARESPSGTTRDVPPSSSVNSAQSPREKKSSSPIPLGLNTNQSSTRASPHSEIRGGSVPGSRGSPVASVHSLDGIPSSSRPQESIHPSITSLPDPGILQGSPRSMDEEQKSLSGRERTPLASSPAGSTHSSIRKPSFEDIGNPLLSGRGRTPPVSSPLASVHSSTRSSRGQSPIASVGSLPGRDSIHPGITSPTAINTSLVGSIHSPLASVHSSTRSSRGQSPIASVGSLPGLDTIHPGITSPAAISSLHSSARSTPRGSSFPRRSSTELPPSAIPKDSEYDALSIHSRGRPIFSYGKRESPRFSTSRTPVDSFLEIHDSKPAFSHELLGSLSQRSSVRPSSFGDQRPRSSERLRDYGHQRREERMIPGTFIPSSSSAFAPTNEDRTKFDVNHNEEEKVILQEQQRLFQEKQFQFEAEIRRLREVNEDLKQQLLSVEAAAALSERDNQRSHGLEATVASLNDTVEEKDDEIARLKKRCDELEKINQEMKDEQESLKTVNKLTYEDLNKENSELRAKINDMRRKTYGSPTRTFSDEILNKTLREKVARLETDKADLKQKYNKIKLELEQTKAEKVLSDSRLKKARSVTDLSEKFNRYTTYSKPELDIYDQSWGKTSSGLGSSRYSWSDNNVDSAYKVSSGTIGDRGLTNGLSTRDKYSSRRDDHVTDIPLSSTSHQRRLHSSMDNDIDVISLEQDFDHRSAHERDRHRTLSSESSNSSLLEYEYGVNIRVPNQSSTYSPRDTRVELRETSRGRRERPHSYHAGTVLDLDRQTANEDINHYRSTSHSPSRTKDFQPTSRTTLDYGTSTRQVDFESKYRTRDYESGPARYGTNSSVTKRYSTSTGYPKDSSPKPFCPTFSTDIQKGMRVMVNRNRGICGHGIVKYVGMLPGREGSYVGVELDSGDGRHDGTFHGQRLFKCKSNRGIFVKASKVLMCYPK
ncbi:uncharacterized protein LOC116303943 [Actinia tenebrosa]|uniref:Uncharacterized protein LOC116303943 n=1 Tax=Actinia tenebrosa TaxID=6105 RepID=A0A6P8IRE9_ACTTE|nr:uncharacterized protein LOC116303943 [Actinia tenebrosa]